MIKTLRKKFIIVATLALVAVIGAFLLAANVANFVGVNRRADGTIDFIEYYGGEIPMPNVGDQQKPIDGFNKLSAETPFKTRYFTVEISDDNLIVNVDRIAAVSAETAKAYAFDLYSHEKTSGFYGNYKYRAVSTENGIMYIFLDCGNELDGFRSFLWTGIAVSGLGILIVFALIVLLSGKVMKPFALAYEKQKRFITDANHEIKTPLAIIKATNEVIEMESGANEWTKTIDKQTARLTALTEKLVFLSRMDEDNAEIIANDFSLSETAEEVAGAFESMAANKCKVYEVNIEPDVIIKGDVSLIGQLISILLDNAFKYSDDHGTINLGIKKEGKNAVISVKNTVDKIDKGNLDVFFDRFYRADKSRNSATGGFGIGLSVAKAIVTAHNGKISAVSRDGKSVEFVAII